MPVARLVTYASLSEPVGDAYSVSLRHVAELEDGREILLLDDRGFSGRSVGGPLVLRREQLERDARACVGPDEPAEGQTWEQAEAAHLETLAARLHEAGVAVEAADLRGLEHEVVFDR